MKTEKKEWRVIFVVYAYLKKTKFQTPNEKDEMSLHLKDFLNSLLRSHISETNSYCILLNKVNENPSKDTCQLPGSREQKPVYDRTVLYRMYTNKRNKTCFKKIETFNTESLFQKTAELIKAFSVIRNDNDLAANRTMLITWDHGSVFGVFRRERNTEIVDHVRSVIINAFNQGSFNRKRDTIPDVATVIDEYFIPARLQIYHRHWDKSSRSYAFPGMAKDGQELIEKKFGDKPLPNLTFDLLYNEDLAKVIAVGLNGKVDIMIMANCYMQNLHAVSAFRDILKILIAPQGDLEYPCYDFFSLLKKLQKHPEISNYEISNYIVKKAAAFFSEGKKNKLSLFATDVSMIGKIEYEISLIADYLKSVIIKHPQFKLILQEIMQFCFTFDAGRRYFSVDILNFLYQIRNYRRDDGTQPDFFEEINIQISDFITTISIMAETYILAKHTGLNFIENLPITGARVSFINNPLPKAFSIYATDNTNFNRVPDIQYIAFRTTLFKITTWDDFLTLMNS